MLKKESREARNLILLLSSATFIAFIVVIALVYYFNSTGTYLLRNVLISPENLKKNVFVGPSGKQAVNLTLDRIEFVYTEPQGSGWKRSMVTEKEYERFYERLYSERSIRKVPQELSNLFLSMPVTSLTIYVKNKERPEAQKEIYQQVQFISKGEVFRLQSSQLQKQHKEKSWLYFRYPGIYHSISELFFED